MSDGSLKRFGLRCLGAFEGVEIWQARLDLSGHELGSVSGLLSPFETLQAARYGSALLRSRFVARRGLLRLLLAGHLGERPESVAIREERGSKPALASGSWHFNVSSSSDVAMFALSTSHEIGIDVEGVDPQFPTEAVARDHFAPSERAALESAGPGSRPLVFFTFWTRKEACAKALGLGICDSFACYETQMPLGSLYTPMPVFHSGSLDSRLTVFDVDAGDGFAAAVAIRF